MTIPDTALLVSLDPETTPIRDLTPDYHRCEACGKIWRREDLDPYEDAHELEENDIIPSGRCPDDTCWGSTYPLAPIPHPFKVWTCSQCGDPLAIGDRLTESIQAIEVGDPAKATEPLAWLLSLWNDPFGRCPSCQETPVLVTVRQAPEEQPAREYAVTWKVDLRATSPEEAAKLAQAMQRDPGTLSTVFEVTPVEGGILKGDVVQVDLAKWQLSKQA